MRAALAALTASFLVSPSIASAHTLASSSIRLIVGEDDLTGTVTMAVATLDQAFDAPERSDVLPAGEYADQVVAYLDAHLTIDGADGAAWAERYSNLVRQTTEGIETISVDVTVDPAGSDPADFAITYDAVIEAVAGHEAVLVLETASGAVSTPGVFTQANDTVFIGDADTDVAITDMISFGYHHVLDGADHLLFLITLLLPATFVASAGRWRPRPGIAPAARRVLHVATAFTAGHSLTLIATSLGWITVPTRLVEVLVAISVAVSSMHAIKPLVRVGESLIAANFGLVHGLAFAGILHDLGLQGRTTTLTLLAFNIGVELAQLAAIALTLPSLYLLSIGRHGRTVRVVGASLALVAACAWIADRLGLVSNPIAPIEARLIAHLWWIVAGLAVLAVGLTADGRSSTDHRSLHLGVEGFAHSPDR